MREWTWQSLAGGVRVMERDPIGILLPSAGILLLQVATLVWLRAAFEGEWTASALVRIVGWSIVAQVVRTLVASPLRAPMIAAGARALDKPATGLPRAVSLLVVDALTGLAMTLAAAIVGVPVGLVAAWTAGRGLYLFAAILAGLAAVGAALVALVIRASLAYAPIEAVVARRGPLDALGVAWEEAEGDRLQLAVLLLCGDVAVGIGGALCGAGALPGYPIGDLAVLHRWARRADPA